MRKEWIASIALLAGLIGFLQWTEIDSSVDQDSEEEVLPMGRWDYQLARLADPRTGKIPEHIRMRELAYASTLPKALPGRDSVQVDFQSIGPYNFAGRTRAFAIDYANPAIYLAGAVSGGMWRSENAGQSWNKVTNSHEHQAVSCIVQDRRPVKSNVWYYGSGETVGNSASKSFSAFYRGSGVYKSTDNGVTWTHLQSTSALAHKDSDWDAVFALETDPLRQDSDIVYAAIQNGIQRSNDGGVSWKRVLGSQFDTDWTDIHMTNQGVCYAAIASNGGSNRGFWRSVDGLNWVEITPNGLPVVHERTIVQSAPSNEDVVYFFTGTPNSGENASTLFKYEYLSGDGTGSGAAWTNLTSGLASANYNVFGGYCQVMNVKPDDENMVFLGGTNLYRSKNGFTDTFQVARIGGYSIDGDTIYSYFNGGGKHYPDQQNLFFHPDDPDFMISTTDGGVHLAEDCSLDTMQWVSLNNGYVSSQFYAINIDHHTVGSEVVLGGLQDRGTWWTNEADPQATWTHVRGADGAYVEVLNDGEWYINSMQYANLNRIKIDENGERSERENIMPKSLGNGSGGGWLFVHPFTLDRSDDEILYLPHQGNIWRNDNMFETDSAQFFSRWRQITSIAGEITAVSSSEAEKGVVYFGTNSGRLFRIDSAHNSFGVVAQNLNDSITTSGYVSNIAIDPFDSDRAIAVFSNYNTISLWFTEDGGKDWEAIEGNLAGNKDEGLPEFLYYIGDGPSIRWAEIVPTAGGNVYYVGTSVGLYSTDSLAGDSTVWVQQGVETIGNVVVDMLQYRHHDGWMAVGTHGNGIYAGTIEYVPFKPTGQREPSIEFEFDLYPNPAINEVNIQWSKQIEGYVELTLFDAVGRPVLIEKKLKGSSHRLDVTGIAKGTYYLQMRNAHASLTKAMVIR